MGLHTGKKSKISISTANADQGIIFKRVDLKDNLIVANFKNVSLLSCVRLYKTKKELRFQL